MAGKSEDEAAASVRLPKYESWGRYEEYFPFGSTSIIKGKSALEVQSKLYRYVGKELDKSTGLYYVEARYLVPWMGRWMTPDTKGTEDGLNLYAYVRGNPTTKVDPTGTNGILHGPATLATANRQLMMAADHTRALQMVNSAITLLQISVQSRSNWLMSRAKPWVVGSVLMPGPSATTVLRSVRSSASETASRDSTPGAASASG